MAALAADDTTTSSESAEGPDLLGSERGGGASLSAYLQATPLALILGLFLLLPILTIGMVSFWDYDSVRVYPDFVTFNYTDILGSWVTWKTYLNTIKFTVIVWLLTTVIGFCGRLLSSLPHPLGYHADGAVLHLHRAVPDVEHHPHDFLGTVSRAKWHYQFDADPTWH